MLQHGLTYEQKRTWSKLFNMAKRHLAAGVSHETIEMWIECENDDRAHRLDNTVIAELLYTAGVLDAPSVISACGLPFDFEALPDALQHWIKEGGPIPAMAEDPQTCRPAATVIDIASGGRA